MVPAVGLLTHCLGEKVLDGAADELRLRDTALRRQLREGALLLGLYDDLLSHHATHGGSPAFPVPYCDPAWMCIECVYHDSVVAGFVRADPPFPRHARNDTIAKSGLQVSTPGVAAHSGGNMAKYDESGHWMWDEATGQWVPAASGGTPAPEAQATAPMPATAVATAPPPAPPGGYAPPATGTPPEPPRKRRTGLVVLIVILVLCALLACCGLAGAGLWAWSSARNGSRQTGTGAGASQNAVDQQLAAEGVYVTPDELVAAWYKAVAAGDLKKLRSISTTGFASQIDGGMFTARDPVTEYRIVSSSAPPKNSKPGDLEFVDVQESTGSENAKTTVTFQVMKTETGYIIAGYTVTATPESGATSESGDAGSGGTSAKGGVITRNEAIDVVGLILDARQHSRVKEARALATAKFQKEAPVFFTPSADAFTNFEVNSAGLSNGVWTVHAKEDWISGPEDTTYTVVTVNGKGLVDSWETAAQ